MKIALMGGGDFVDNTSIDKKVLALLENKKNPLFTYIPSSFYQSDIEFNELIEHYEELGLKRFIKFELDASYGIAFKKAIFKSDIIHLGGGNTFYFLKNLRRNNFIHELKNWVHAGGILTGLSAGAILLTKNINTASFPEFDCDENEENLKNLKAMGLVPFEFFPHYRNSKRYDRELLNYSKTVKHPLYASSDGAGIVISDDEISFIGRTACFFKGTKNFINK
ncbi:MAG: peptidase S51 [Halobacteriovoraceae bacterium]|nr:peptidase S51 [Halobacteriovoraceae bacterium]|tara:strand:+ start:3555 stop:4223 length:669 start_codon:yes stop_codon:yes gene_type:complete